MADEDKVSYTKEELEALLATHTAEALTDIKAQLDGAYSARDEALQKQKELEEAKNAEHIRLLNEQGKKEEALTLQMAQLQEQVTNA